ncbi:OLC1v1011658C2 [Oldenlandia corymbosa var. corymbosa]|uniref:RING-type E3 ubiquitin transferase n=1 Tax=Oldenlandia corymbosa var. corymbosa TaxID=529605 RepID=A0AAV1DVX3_OLDCO|nr:OLC1v1011658C2 [Oldenlandia corymbosa var. corymbosa]
MENNHHPKEKIYVAIGTDLSEGFATLKWTLKRWASASVKIVILYADNTISKEYVYTPIGKIPASSVREEKLKVLDKSEEAKTDKILSKLVAFCGKVKAEGLRIGRYEDSNHKVILRLITILHITKLVIAFSFLRPPSWKWRNAANASFSLYHEKPDFCELFVIYEGKLVFLREGNNEALLIEDDQGMTVSKLTERPSFRGWIVGKLFPENAREKNPCESASPAISTAASLDQWEKHSEELDKYFNELSSTSTANEGEIEAANDTMIRSQSELKMAEKMGAEERLDVLKMRIRDTKEKIQMNREEVKANIKRYAKATWAIGLCTSRVNELEAQTHEETSKRMELQKDLDRTKEELSEIHIEVEEKRSKLDSILQLQRELSNKLQLSNSAKTRVESQLEKAVRERSEMVQEIEELRRQRDVYQRRIEFCREKDAIGMAKKLSSSSSSSSSNGLGFDYSREFSAAEIRAATDDFAQRLRFKSGGDWTNVYKGRISKTTVAIKLFESVDDDFCQEAFLEKVRLMGSIRHPHVLSMMGFCTELKCIVFEYMHNGCLRDSLFSRQRTTSKGTNRGLKWHDRVRIAAEVCTALSFLHKATPAPFTHGNLNPSRILLDKNKVAKLYGFQSYENATIMSDVRAFGTLILQLLTGRNWAEIGEDAILMMDSSTLSENLDKKGGQWPLDVAVELAGIARCCLSSSDEIEHSEVSSRSVMRWVNKVRKKADDLRADGESLVEEGETNIEEEHNVPSVFFCPIYQVSSSISSFEYVLVQ